MSEKNETEMISRRKALFLFGLGALSLAIPPTVLPVSQAEAQQPTPQTPQPGTTPETGVERRHERREGRRERRHERREARRDRRHERRETRRDRRQERREARRERRQERTAARQQRRGTKPPTSSTPQ
jgi:hypothetical protein